MHASKDIEDLKADALEIIQSGIDASVHSIERQLRLEGNSLIIQGKKFELDHYEGIYCVAVGKAAWEMAKQLHAIHGLQTSETFIITKYDHAPAGALTSPLPGWEIIEAAHPVPDENSLRAATRLEEKISTWPKNSLILLLLSGGASALLAAPVSGINLADKQKVTELLLASGADIREINAVRKHLSLIKGGGFLRLAQSREAITLAFSDVVGDNRGTIGSGISYFDESTFADALEVIERYHLTNKIPQNISQYLTDGAAGKHNETLSRESELFHDDRYFILSSNHQSLLAAHEKARSLGYNSLILTSSLEGDTAQSARFHSSILTELDTSDHPVAKPACILSGGETTVKLSEQSGKGGRNQQFILELIEPLSHLEHPALAMSIGTDGTDGPTDAAGAVAHNKSFSLLQEKYGDKKAALETLQNAIASHNAYPLLDETDHLIRTGATGTNVMDIRILLMK